MRINTTSTCIGLGLAVACIALTTRAEPTEATLKASEVLPAEWRSGSNFQVRENVVNDGLINTYYLTTDYGPCTVESTALLAKRISELRALAQIEQIKKSKEFTSALKNAGKAPFEAVANLIDAPVDTVKNVGSGIGRWFKDVGRSITSDDPNQPNVLNTAIGQAPVRRKFAYEFEVDPYTSYLPLDTALNEVAWASAGGGLTVKVALAGVGGDTAKALRLTGSAGGMRALVRDNSPAELNKIVEAQLLELGASKSQAKQFMENYAFNPQERALLAGELVAMKGIENRAAFLNSAAKVPNESVAVYMRVRAQLMSKYAQNGDIVRVVEAGSVPFLQTTDGAVVGVFPLDHVLWTPELAQRMDAVDRELAQLPNLGSKALLILGTVDPEAKDALAKRNWKVLDRQLSRLQEGL